MGTHVKIQEIVHKHVRLKGKNISGLCEELGWPRNKWYRFQNTGYLDIPDLQALSNLLEHDFFQYYSKTFSFPEE